MEKYKKEIGILIIGTIIVLRVVSILGVFSFQVNKSTKKTIEKNIVKTIKKEELPKNYAIYMLVDEKWRIHIAEDKGRFIADFRDQLFTTGGVFYQGKLYSWKGKEAVKSEDYSFSKFEKRFGFSLEDLTKRWKGMISNDSFDSKRCEKHLNGTDYEMILLWQNETNRTSTTFAVDTNKEGSAYDHLAFEHICPNEKGHIMFTVHYTNESPVDFEDVSTDAFYNTQDPEKTESFQEIYNDWNDNIKETK